MPRARSGRGRRHIGISAPRSRSGRSSFRPRISGPKAASSAAARSSSISAARAAAAASAEPPPMPDAAGRVFRQCDRGPPLAPEEARGLQDEIGLIGGHALGLGAVDSDGETVSLVEADNIARRAEGDEAVEQVIAVGASAGDVERQIDLRGREDLNRHRPPCEGAARPLPRVRGRGLSRACGGCASHPLPPARRIGRGATGTRPRARGPRPSRRRRDGR